MKAAMIAAIAAAIALSPQLLAQDAVSRLPAEITGKWSNDRWGGPWVLKTFDLPAKTAVASLGRGGDSCGFSDVPAEIRRWDGRTLEVEVRTRACRVPVMFRINRDGSRWEGVVENDVRTVKAEGRDS